MVEKPDDSDQFTLGRDFVKSFDVTIDLNIGLIRIRNPEKKYVKRPMSEIKTDKNKIATFLDR